MSFIIQPLSAERQSLDNQQSSDNRMLCILYYTNALNVAVVLNTSVALNDSIPSKLSTQLKQSLEYIKNLDIKNIDNDSEKILIVAEVTNILTDSKNIKQILMIIVSGMFELEVNSGSLLKSSREDFGVFKEIFKAMYPTYESRDCVRYEWLIDQFIKTESLVYMLSLSPPISYYNSIHNYDKSLEDYIFLAFHHGPNLRHNKLRKVNKSGQYDIKLFKERRIYKSIIVALDNVLIPVFGSIVGEYLEEGFDRYTDNL